MCTLKGRWRWVKGAAGRKYMSPVRFKQFMLYTLLNLDTGVVSKFLIFDITILHVMIWIFCLLASLSNSACAQVLCIFLQAVIGVSDFGVKLAPYIRLKYTYLDAAKWITARHYKWPPPKHFVKSRGACEKEISRKRCFQQSWNFFFFANCAYPVWKRDTAEVFSRSVLNLQADNQGVTLQLFIIDRSENLQWFEKLWE